MSDIKEKKLNNEEANEVSGGGTCFGLVTCPACNGTGLYKYRLEGDTSDRVDKCSWCGGAKKVRRVMSWDEYKKQNP